MIYQFARNHYSLGLEKQGQRTVRSTVRHDLFDKILVKAPAMTEILSLVLIVESALVNLTGDKHVKEIRMLTRPCAITTRACGLMI
jgi:hypothetical protein